MYIFFFLEFVRLRLGSLARGTASRSRRWQAGALSAWTSSTTAWNPLVQPQDLWLKLGV